VESVDRMAKTSAIQGFNPFQRVCAVSLGF
jgi:hypothetical protein